MRQFKSQSADKVAGKMVKLCLALRALLTKQSNRRHTIAAVTILLCGILLVRYILDRLTFEEANIVSQDIERAVSVANMFAAGISDATDNSLTVIDVAVTGIAAIIDHTDRGEGSWTKWTNERGYQFLSTRTSYINTPQLRGLSLFDENGNQLFASWDRNLMGVNITDRPYFQKIRDGALMASYGPYIGRNTGTYTFAVTHRLVDNDGIFSGLVFAALEPAYFQTVCNHIRHDSELNAFFVNADGVVISSCDSPSAAGALSEKIIGASAYNATSAMPVFGNFVKSEYIYIRHQLSSHPDLGYIVTINSRYFLSKWDKIGNKYRNIKAIILCVAVFSISCVLFYIFRSCRRENELIRKKNEVASALRIIDEQSSILNATLDALPGGFYYKDKEGRYMGCNRLFSDFIGRDKAEVIGKSVFDISPLHLATIYHESDSVLLRNGGQTVYETEVEAANGHRQNVIISKAVFKCAATDSAGIVGIVIDITEQKNREVELNKAILNAEIANKSRSAFMSNITHELRTPLNAIIGFSDILRQRNTDEISGPDVAEYSQMIYLSGRRLLDMVSDILDIISIDVSQNIIACEHIDISSKYTANVLNIIRARAASHQLSFSENLSDQKCTIYADPIRFKQIIYFICDNAVKYNRPGGSIRLTAERVDGGVALICNDTGIGIPPDMIENIFKPFVRVEKGRGIYTEGTGLGLTIVYAIVKLHGGHVKISSTYGSGTTVTIFFPYEDFLGASI